MNFIISNNSEIPIYQQIKKEIINSISNNELKETAGIKASNKINNSRNILKILL